MSEGIFALLLIIGILFFAFIIAPPKRKDEEETEDGVELVTLTENLNPDMAREIQAFLETEGIKVYRDGDTATMTDPLAVGAITGIKLKVKKSDLEKVLELMKQQQKPEPAEAIGCPAHTPPPQDNMPIPDQKYIEFNCPLCGKDVSFPESFEGKEEQCPFCLKNIIVS